MSYASLLKLIPPETLPELLTHRRQVSTNQRETEACAIDARDADDTREKCRSLVDFIRAAWCHIPELSNIVYVHGWHVDVIALHLEAISSGKLLRLGYQNRFLANVPPGTMKSLLVSVFWPAWEWTQNPALQYIATSYREDFCNRDTSRMRDLVCSAWYQKLWGKDHEVDGKIVRGVEMDARGDSRISNTAGGWREGVPFGSLTGNRADRILIDDPSSVDTAESDAQRNRTSIRFRESVPLRLNDPIKSAIVVIMQRLHVDDVSGIIEKLDLPYIKVMLPMEFEEARRCVTCIAKDPRRREGELLFPKRFPREVVERDKVPLGPNGVAGQLQQRPFLRGGAMFKLAWFSTVSATPKGTRYVRHWDLAGSKRKSVGAYGQAWTAGVKVGKGPGEDGDYYISHVYRLQEEGDEVRRAIKNMAAIDGPSVRISLPQDPGQAGKLQARDMKKMLAGYSVRVEIESGSKEVRAEPFASMYSTGCVKIVKTGDLVKDAWIEPYVAELLAFPGSPVKDQVDATSGAYTALGDANSDLHLVDATMREAHARGHSRREQHIATACADRAVTARRVDGGAKMVPIMCHGRTEMQNMWRAALGAIVLACAEELGELDTARQAKGANSCGAL
jgi:predicted phage terminase large subunit-like protein